MRVARKTPTNPIQPAPTPAQLALRSALGPYLDEKEPRDLIEALKRIQHLATTDSPIRSVANQTLSQRLLETLTENEGSRNASMMAEQIHLLGRFDRLLGWQTGKARLINQQRLDQMAQSLIEELETIGLKPRHPLAGWPDHQSLGASKIHPDVRAPWPPTLSPTLNYWVCELGRDAKLAVPASMVNRLIDAPVLTPIEAGTQDKIWGFRGLEWDDTALPAIALSASGHYRSPLSVCILILPTPREVASEFAHFGLICPTLPSWVSAQELSVDHHQFIDWVAVVREMKALF